MQYHLTDIPEREIVRYALGADLPELVPTEFLKQARAAAEQILACCQPRFYHVVCDTVPLLDTFLSGRDIRRHLESCAGCVLLCATLGPQADALIRRAQVRDMAQALWLDAAASAAIEEVCDAVQSQIADELHCRLTARFSCGYGDLPLTAQGDFLAALDAGRKIGLSLSPSGMLVPIKSVTAVMGILPEGAGLSDGQNPCEGCRLWHNPCPGGRCALSKTEKTEGDALKK